MPYKSDAQRRFFHTDTAKKAGITGKEVNEFDKASKGMNLPEKTKKMADGGVSDAIDPLEQTGETDPGHMKAIIDALGSGMAMGSLGAGVASKLPELSEALGEAGSIGSKAPEMQGMPGQSGIDWTKVKAFAKGIMGKGTPNEMTLWGVKGEPSEIAKLGYGEDPASIPESVLKQHGLLPDVSTTKSAPTHPLYNQGGRVESIKKDKSDAQTADDIDPVITGSTDTVKKSQGGEIDWKDKLKVVLDKMKGPQKMADGGYPTASESDDGLPKPVSFLDKLANAIKGAGQDVMGPTTDVGDLTAARLSGSPVTAPQMNQQSDAQDLLTVPHVPPQVPPPQPQNLPVQAQTPPTPPPAPQNVPSGNAQAPAQPSATDLLGKLTNNDSTQMQALLSQLKDQDKRSAFAQALGVIGDTFGNMGMAKAGQRPEGFTTPQMLQGMNEQSKQAKIDMLNKQLASDPNSQSSQAAQMVLKQAMGIKQGDPREAAISKMPAQAVAQYIPQMTDAIKANMEGERNLIMAKEADYTHQIATIQQQIASGQLNRENKTAAITALNDVAKNAPFYRPDLKNKALEMAQQLSTEMAGNATQSPIVSQHPNGSVIRRVK